MESNDRSKIEAKLNEALDARDQLNAKIDEYKNILATMPEVDYSRYVLGKWWVCHGLTSDQLYYVNSTKEDATARTNTNPTGIMTTGCMYTFDKMPYNFVTLSYAPYKSAMLSEFILNDTDVHCGQGVVPRYEKIAPSVAKGLLKSWQDCMRNYMTEADPTIRS